MNGPGPGPADAALHHVNFGKMCRLAGRIDEAITAGRRGVNTGRLDSAVEDFLERWLPVFRRKCGQLPKLERVHLIETRSRRDFPTSG